MKLVLLDDGFNGSTCFFDACPLAVDGNFIKLRCAEPGSEYLTAWKRNDEVIRAIANQSRIINPAMVGLGDRWIPIPLVEARHKVRLRTLYECGICHRGDQLRTFHLRTIF